LRTTGTRLCIIRFDFNLLGGPQRRRPLLASSPANIPSTTAAPLSLSRVLSAAVTTPTPTHCHCLRALPVPVPVLVPVPGSTRPRSTRRRLSAQDSSVCGAHSRHGSKTRRTDWPCSRRAPPPDPSFWTASHSSSATAPSRNSIARTRPCAQARLHTSNKRRLFRDLDIRLTTPFTSSTLHTAHHGGRNNKVRCLSLHCIPHSNNSALT
jgi:hypothetical protein